MAVSQIPYNESLIKINSNSSFRDLNNNEITISNINSSEPHVAKVVFHEPERILFIPKN